MARIVLGLSGGVDSALAAALLQERGWDVVGCFLKVDLTTHDSRLTTCPWKEDLPMAHRVAAHLNIPLIVKDVSVEYEREVLKPMIAAYQRGETPNPDTTCNRYVKFNALTAVARAVGAERIATGHYARVCGHSHEYANGHESTNTRMRPSHFSPSRGEGEREGVGKVELWRALDHTKDQSYFLWQLTQEQLSMCEFPLGEWRKDDVRAEARRRGLPNWDRDSTSGVCFLGEVNLTEFLSSSFSPFRMEGEREGEGSPATVVTTSGEIIGTIPNAEALTIGQRVPLAGQQVPHYVIANCPKSSFGQNGHRIIVSATPDDPARYTKTITTGAPNWIGSPPQFSPPPQRTTASLSFEISPPKADPPLEENLKSMVGEREGVQSVLRCTARIRHRQEPQPCTIFSPPPSEGEREVVGLRITFTTPLTGVAPGQAVILTDGDRVLGGAVIGGAVIDRRLQ